MIKDSNEKKNKKRVVRGSETIFCKQNFKWLSLTESWEVRYGSSEDFFRKGQSPKGGGETPFGSFYVRSAILIQGQREGQCKTSHIVVKYQPASVAHVGEEGKGGQIFFSPGRGVYY